LKIRTRRLITDTVHEESAYKLVDKTNTGED